MFLESSFYSSKNSKIVSTDWDILKWEWLEIILIPSPYLVFFFTDSVEVRPTDEEKFASMRLIYF